MKALWPLGLLVVVIVALLVVSTVCDRRSCKIACDNKGAADSQVSDKLCACIMPDGTVVMVSP